MSFATWCIPIAMFLPLIWAYVAKANGRGYDNSRPREWLEAQTGRAQRANWAQMNSYEAFPPFAAAVIVAQMNNADIMIVNALAGLFIVVRVLHGIFYVNDKANLRTLAWLAGYGATIAIFLVDPAGV